MLKKGQDKVFVKKVLLIRFRGTAPAPMWARKMAKFPKLQFKQFDIPKVSDEIFAFGSQCREKTSELPGNGSKHQSNLFL